MQIEIDGNKVEIDDNIVCVVNAINEFPGLRTTESCGGHKRNNTENKWIVFFNASPNEVGFRSLEFLAWAINDDLCCAQRVHMCLESAPPYLSTPGETLHFYIEGVDGKPDRAAEFINKVRLEHYVPVCGRKNKPIDDDIIPFIDDDIIPF